MFSVVFYVLYFIPKYTKKPATKTIPLPFVADTFYLQILYDVFPYAAFLSGFASYLNRSFPYFSVLTLNAIQHHTFSLSIGLFTYMFFSNLLLPFDFFSFFYVAQFLEFLFHLITPPRTTFVHINTNIPTCLMSSVFYFLFYYLFYSILKNK